ncbi:hypothetical protein K0M31_001107 [Melipona bicolor]|uniref:Uncharacterized protein n=1 Tax=Melipona bicolor TaxID=60889 RepID=A0AA40GEV7_9HYME|nr:hypothetical protein K0M31_001107 [Melipona bicolor]
MFCLKGRNSGDTKLKDMLKKDDFGWWLNNEDNLKSPRTARSKDRQSVGSTESMFSCVDSDDSDSYFLAQEFKQECNDNCEKIELTSLINEDLDINLIEQDAIRNDTDHFAPFQTEDGIRCSTDLKLKSQESHGMCYTPERLVRSQKYRILTPSPRYLSISQVRDMAENPWKTSLCRRGLNYLIDSNQDGAMQLKAFMNPNPKEIVVPTIDLHRWRKYERVYNISNGTIGDKNETKKEDVSNDSESLNMSDCSFKKRSIYERLNDTWESCDKLRTRNSFSACSETNPFEDTSDIQSNDGTSNTHTLNMQSTSLCPSDELATTNYKIDATQEKCSTTNEVVPVFEALDTNPEEAAVVLEEDRFYDSISTHDQLTRLALAIETDENMSTVFEKGALVHLQNKIKKLQDSNKDIYRDISDLRKSFQCDEEKMADILLNTSKLRQEVHDLRYLDDLLNLLRGELGRISKRKWPFVVRRTNDHSEEMNLIV